MKRGGRWGRVGFWRGCVSSSGVCEVPEAVGGVEGLEVLVYWRGVFFIIWKIGQRELGREC